MWFWWRLTFLINGTVKIITNPIINGINIENSGITVVPIILISPDDSGFIESEI